MGTVRVRSIKLFTQSKEYYEDRPGLVPEKGEIYVEMNNGVIDSFKIGNGVDVYLDLPYFSNSSEFLGELLELGDASQANLADIYDEVDIMIDEALGAEAQNILNDAKEYTDQELENYQGQLDDIGLAIQEIEEDIINNNDITSGRLGVVEGRLGVVEGRLDVVEGELSTVDARISQAVSASDSSTDTKIHDAEHQLKDYTDNKVNQLGDQIADTLVNANLYTDAIFGQAQGLINDAKSHSIHVAKQYVDDKAIQKSQFASSAQAKELEDESLVISPHTLKHVLNSITEINGGRIS